MRSRKIIIPADHPLNSVKAGDRLIKRSTAFGSSGKPIVHVVQSVAPLTIVINHQRYPKNACPYRVPTEQELTDHDVEQQRRLEERNKTITAQIEYDSRPEVKAESSIVWAADNHQLQKIGIDRLNQILAWIEEAK